METKEIVLPQGWEVDKIENGKIILKESKKELPKTWEDCYREYSKNHHREAINLNADVIPMESLDQNEPVPISSKTNLPAGLGRPVLALHQLLICRDVYRQGWKPDWDKATLKYCIEFTATGILLISKVHTGYIFSFQSEEVAQLFIKNFLGLLRQVQQLMQ